MYIYFQIPLIEWYTYVVTLTTLEMMFASYGYCNSFPVYYHILVKYSIDEQEELIQYRSIAVSYSYAMTYYNYDIIIKNDLL